MIYFFSSSHTGNLSLLPEHPLLVMVFDNIFTVLQDVMIIKAEKLFSQWHFYSA